MLDRDLAILYGVTTGNLNKAVKRNIERFPEDFMFQLTKDEFQNLIFHFGRSSWGGIRKLPCAFTEQGVAMLSSVLRSDRAIQVNIQIMRAFTKLRGMLVSYEELKQAIIDLAKKHDEDVTFIFMELDRLNRILELRESKRQIGFKKNN